MTYRIRRATQFKKDVKRTLKRGKDLEQLLAVVQELVESRPLPKQYYAETAECVLGLL